MASRNIHPTNHAMSTTEPAAQWSQLLIAESPRLDETGTLGALVSIRLVSADDRNATQAVKLMQRIIARTDRVNVVDSAHLAVLLTPVAGITDLQDRVNRIHSSLETA